MNKKISYELTNIQPSTKGILIKNKSKQKLSTTPNHKISKEIIDRKGLNVVKIRILFIDVETAPIIASVWGLFDQNVSLNQVKSDRHLLSFAAKWADSNKVIYMDQSKEKNIENDKKLAAKLWELLDEADLVVGQNSNAFDIKIINSRLIVHGFPPPSSYKKADTLLIAKKNFSFISNKLEYLSEQLCTKYKKLKHDKFPGFELWSQCLAGNKQAWAEMRKYNEFDVLSTEELYNRLKPWDNSVNYNNFHDGEDTVCSCGSTDFKRNGYAYTSVSKFQRYKCVKCGHEVRGRTNLNSKEKMKSLKMPTTR